VVRLDDDVNIEALTGRLDELGYVLPAADPLDGAVWVGGADLVAGIEVSLTPVLAHLAVIADRRLLVMSDAEDYGAAGQHGRHVRRGVAAEHRGCRQGGTCEERFDVTSGAVSDRVATLALSPVRDRMDLVSDLTGGPLMFARCGR
jgi:hypothetical protein